MADQVETVTTQTVEGTPAPTETRTETVQAPKSIREHYEAAKTAQSKADQAPDAAAPGDDTKPEPETVEQPQAGDQPEEAAPSEDTLLTADEVAKLSPKERTLYEKAQKNYTIKTQELARQRKELEPWKDLISNLQDPARWKDTVRQLAQQAEILPKAEQQAVQAEAEKTVAELPEELKFLQPYFEQFGQKLLGQLQSKIDPVVASQNEIVMQKIAESTEATMKSFGEKHKGWEAHETAMTDLAKQIQPVGNMSDYDYMEMLYKLATFDMQSADRTKQIAAKIQKSAAAAETPSSGVQSERVEVALPSNLRGASSSDRLKAAFEAAKRGEHWTG
jgi:hypothetical protein